MPTKEHGNASSDYIELPLLLPHPPLPLNASLPHTDGFSKQKRGAKFLTLCVSRKRIRSDEWN